MAIALTSVLFLFAMFGVAAVDAGVWFTDRRDAQADADAIALAGAIELPSWEDDAGAAARAEAAALEWALANGVAEDEVTIEVINTCFSANDAIRTGVRATVEREAAIIFARMMPNIDAPTVRTTATACSGMAVEMTRFVPWAVESAGDCFTNEVDPALRRPITGQRCQIVVGGGDSSSGSVGQLALGPSIECSQGTNSGSNYEQNIIHGTNLFCGIGDSVTSNQGVNVGPTRQALNSRLSAEGACSMNAVPFFTDVQNRTNAFNASGVLVPLAAPSMGSSSGAIDDFFEIWGPGPDYDPSKPAERLTPYDCVPSTDQRESSPRNIVLLVVNRIGVYDGTGCANSACYEIRGFARFYVEGCTTGGVFSAKCSGSGGGGSFTIHGRFVDSVTYTTGRVGLTRYGDVQTFLLR